MNGAISKHSLMEECSFPPKRGNPDESSFRQNLGLVIISVISKSVMTKPI